jgi:hypothetical protein
VVVFFLNYVPPAGKILLLIFYAYIHFAKAGYLFFGFMGFTSVLNGSIWWLNK